MQSVSECCFPNCAAAPTDKLDLPLCDRHAVATHRAVSALLSTVDPRSVPPMLVHRPLGEDYRRGPTKHVEGRVYFVSFAGRIKIGFTTNMGTRMSAVPHDRVVAHIPGTRSTEAALHRRFAHLRTVGEWFEAGPDLLAYLDTVKAAA